MGPIGYTYVWYEYDARQGKIPILSCECSSHDVQTDSYFVCMEIAMLSCSSGARPCIVRRVRTLNAPFALCSTLNTTTVTHFDLCERF